MKAGWQRNAIGNYCEVIAGQSPEGKFYNTDRIGMPFYQGKKDFGDKFIKAPTTWTSDITKTAQKGDILMSVRAPVGPINFATETVCIGRGLAAIRSKGQLDGDFLFYQLLHLQPEIAGKEGAVFASINKSEISSLPISVGPLPEQHRIVAILDEAFGGIATAKANTEKNLRNARALFESHLESVFTKRGGGWVDRTLDKVCIVERGSSPRPIKNYFTTAADGVNWIKIGDTEEGGKYVFSTAQKITPDGAKQSRYVKEGDFILTNSMSLGRPYIMKVDGYIHDGWFVLRLGKGINSEFFYYLLSSSYVQGQFHALAAGAVVKNISGDLVKKAVLPIPPLVQQHDLVERFVGFSAETQRLESIYQKKLLALDDLKKSLLHQAFSGQL
ncbi:restriction endonuclease subunit S [Ferrovum sp.]|uniref:restriction endonuclease subunit S n=1 Tax=Ferrovum sp. TaxID=2609467 RepID=UPI0026397C26|nr:restriction endonuclease subunit S [Ferrovum sp.]